MAIAVDVDDLFCATHAKKQPKRPSKKFREQLTWRS
jgi:hypothetical protein